MNKTREIKFRAWDNEEKKMVFSTGHGADSFWYGVSDGQIDGETVMQFTGLKDKNGKEIYQNDCLGDVWGGTYIDWCDKQGGWEIFTCEKECMACMGDVHWWEIVEDIKREVIGNIYENPELLTPPQEVSV